MATSDCYDEVVVDFFLKEKGSIVMSFVSFYEFFKLSHPRFKRKQKGKLLKKHLNLSGPFSKQKMLQLST